MAGALTQSRARQTAAAMLLADSTARRTPGFSGADLANLVNEAALFAARGNKRLVDMDDFEKAKDKILMGAERKSMIISPNEKKLTAYHEAGHTMVAKLLPGTDPIHKVTIIPRGMALGLTQQLPIDEKHTYPRDYLVNNIAILLGGRAAEALVFDDVTTGMSERLGPLTYGKKEEQIFLGREIAQHRDFSEATAEAIDEEVRAIIDMQYDTVYALLSKKREVLERLAENLLERESLDTDEVDLIVNGGDLRATTDASPPESDA